MKRYNCTKCLMGMEIGRPKFANSDNTRSRCSVPGCSTVFHHATVDGSGKVKVWIDESEVSESRGYTTHVLDGGV